MSIVYHVVPRVSYRPPTSACVFLTPKVHQNIIKAAGVTVARWAIRFAGHFAQGQALSILIWLAVVATSGERSNANR